MSDDDIKEYFRQMNMASVMPDSGSVGTIGGQPKSALSGFLEQRDRERAPGAYGEPERFTDRMGDWVSDKARGAGLTPDTSMKLGQGVALLGEIAPGIGDAQAIQDWKREADQGNILGGTLAAAGLAIPGSNIIKKGFKAGADTMEDVAGEILGGVRMRDVPEVNVEISKPPITKAPKRVGTTGKYSGAPDGIRSPQALGKLRNSLFDMAEEGIPGRSWYDQSSQLNRDLTGDRPGYTQLKALMDAQTSQGASVPANQTFGIKGYNQYVTGNEINTGRFPNAVRRMTNQIPEGNVTMGAKVGPFYEGVTVKPGEEASRPTNDLWMGRAFGYKRKDPKTGDLIDWDGGFSGAQHRFMDAEMQELVNRANAEKLGGFDDWNLEKMEAAIWTSIKSRSEGIPVEKAAEDFSSNLDRLTANINVESEPALGLNHLAGLRENPEALMGLQEAQRTVMSDDHGRDILSLAAGGLTRPTETGFGNYKGFSAPADVVQTLVGTDGLVMDPASTSLMRGISAGHGLLRGQESVGMNFFKPGGKLVERNAADIDVGGALTQAEMTEFGAKVDELFGGNVFPVNTKKGVRLMTDPDGLKAWAKERGVEGDQNVAKEWQKEINNLVKSEFNTKPTWGVTSGDLIGSWDEYTPSAYLKELEASGVGDDIDQVMGQLAERLEKVDQAMTEIYEEVGPRSERLMMVREALINKGLKGVQELVDKGLVPAAVLTILGAGVALPQSGQPAGASESA
jgi:hypothetical protein